MNNNLLDEISQLEAVTFEIEDIDALDQTLPLAAADGSTSCCSCTSTSSCSSTSC